MHAALMIPAAGVLGALSLAPSTCGADHGMDALARRVLEGDGADAAIEELRAAGPSGLDALLRLRDSINALSTVERLDPAIDRVAGQRFASVSRLYWYTDLEAAKAEARRTHRPILSLRMLGRLTDELSCANSRFFRTILYPHPAVRAMLARDFVLHWSSERDVPVMTIDFGDGRKLVQTITGNSIHYVLGEDGSVIDAIPGLYSPAAFIDRLDWAKSQARASAQIRAVNHRAASRRTGISLPTGGGRSAVPAREAIAIAATKSVVEAPKLGLRIPARGGEGDEGVQLAEETKDLMRIQNPSLSARQLEEMMVNLKKSIALDAAQNENELHRRIHQRLAAAPSISWDELNAWVYAELFATPASDPWLGLHDPTVFTGLDRGGLR
jgi:hypothetical protein